MLCILENINLAKDNNLLIDINFNFNMSNTKNDILKFYLMKSKFIVKYGTINKSR